MNVFKFGGASVKDAEGVRNIISVLNEVGKNQLVIVVSAMGKMTNALEEVVSLYLSKKKETSAALQGVYEFHYRIIKDLFEGESHPVFDELKGSIEEIAHFLKTNKSDQHAYVYDQVVSHGELISTRIISQFLNENGVENTFLDARECIRTDMNHREANVSWELSHEAINDKVDRKGITITQGFIGSEQDHHFTTTLGREGSDYSAAIFAYCLNAESVTIWKDVPGVLSADPRYFKDPILLNHISYKEAIELAFYGASVIHPKTLQPLQRKEIPLYVRSFFAPNETGTCVGKGKTLDPMTSCFILKKDQVLISLSSLDFSFIMEDSIGDVFKLLHQNKMKVNLIQNSAISFSVCVDNKFNRLDELLNQLREKFRVTWNEGVTLYTIRHTTPKEIDLFLKGRTMLLMQETRETVQLVIRE
jgi:aspartate kinase